MALHTLRKLEDLKMECEAMGLNPILTLNRKNKETGVVEKQFSKTDYMLAIRDFYINQRKQEGRYTKGLEYMLTFDSPMLAKLYSACAF